MIKEVDDVVCSRQRIFCSHQANKQALSWIMKNKIGSPKHNSKINSIVLTLTATTRHGVCLFCMSSSSPLYPFSVSLFPISSSLDSWDADWSRAYCHGYRTWKSSRDLVGRREERQSSLQPLLSQMTLSIPSVHKEQPPSAPADTQWMS